MNGKPDREAELHIEIIKSQKHYKFSKSIPKHPTRLLFINNSQLSGKTTMFFNML